MRLQTPWGTSKPQGVFIFNDLCASRYDSMRQSATLEAKHKEGYPEGYSIVFSKYPQGYREKQGNFEGIHVKWIKAKEPFAEGESV